MRVKFVVITCVLFVVLEFYAIYFIISTVKQRKKEKVEKMEPKFIKVYNRDGSPIYLNARYVISIRYSDHDNCVIVEMTDGSYYCTSIDFDYFSIKGVIY